MAQAQHNHEIDIPSLVHHRRLKLFAMRPTDAGADGYSQVLRVAACTQVFPYCYLQDGKFQGHEVALLETFAAYAGLRVEYTACRSPGEAVTEVVVGNAHVAVGYLVPGPDAGADRQVLWTLPFLRVTRGALMRKLTARGDGEFRDTPRKWRALPNLSLIHI